MRKLTAADLARNFSAVLERIVESGDSFLVERGSQPVAQLSPG